MSYIITTLCLGQKYEPIRNHWTNRINAKCANCNIKIFNDFNILNDIV